MHTDLAIQTDHEIYFANHPSKQVLQTRNNLCELPQKTAYKNFPGKLPCKLLQTPVPQTLFAVFKQRLKPAIEQLAGSISTYFFEPQTLVATVPNISLNTVHCFQTVSEQSKQAHILRTLFASYGHSLNPGNKPLATSIRVFLFSLEP